MLRNASLLLCLVLAGPVLAGCVEPFSGSNIQISLNEGVPVPAREGVTPPFGTPPAGTHMSLYAVEYVYERNPNGSIAEDQDGQPIVADSFSFRIVDFELRPLVQLTSPCFIEVENARFPGLHVTNVADKLREVTGIANPLEPPSGASDNDIIDILTADRRMNNLPALQNEVKAVTSVSHAQYPDTGPACVEDGGPADMIPPIDCTGDESNAARLTACQAFWADNPGFYEGNDKVFTIPLNGDWIGSVNGINPINNGFLGGAGLFVDYVLTDIDSLIMSWQYKDFDGDGEPDYPDGTPDADKSDTGYLFMQGQPVSKTRGVINIPLQNPGVNSISGEAVIFADLDQDEVNF